METRDRGLLLGLIGVVIFSGSLPATRAAVTGFEPIFLTAARALLAALGAVIALGLFENSRPLRSEVPSLLVVAASVVVGFPLLSALALMEISVARGVLFTGLLPLSTAAWAMVRGGERPRPAFWVFALCGSGLVAAFALFNGGSQGAWLGDALMLAAIVVCGLGYAEGAVLSRRLGGWQVICWALALSAPIMLGLALMTWPAHWPTSDSSAWLGLAYVAMFSMLIGFFFWYRALAIGGSSRVGQLQLLQPLLGLGLCAVLLHESIAWSLVATCIGVLGCVAGARRLA
ncbi:DMT family transporter [Steroidobacter sp.]|uniref:DMT family transporter n=1 Tax=Steroidobacter sp. TaxID=1978227 RepID=UPI001A3CD203|nr:DMT family transporter [Steroidobacter sp.]MBL8270922.1 DMT family transporter [Steroidobacter sp.]